MNPRLVINHYNHRSGKTNQVILDRPPERKCDRTFREVPISAVVRWAPLQGAGPMGHRKSSRCSHSPGVSQVIDPPNHP